MITIISLGVAVVLVAVHSLIRRWRIKRAIAKLDVKLAASRAELQRLRLLYEVVRRERDKLDDPNHERMWS